MARRKTLPESLRAKLALAERLSTLRLELYGERGGPEMARRLGIPVRTWYNYEGGVTVPAEVVLKIIELTSVEPVWLLHGKGPKYRQVPRGERPEHPSKPAMTVGALLRTALQLLENDGTSRPASEEGEGDLGGDRLRAPARPARPQGVARGPAGEPLHPGQRQRDVADRGRRGLDRLLQARAKTPASSTARWWSSGSTTSPRSAGSGTAADTPCSAPRTPRPSPSSSSSTWKARPSSRGSAASSGSTRLTEHRHDVPRPGSRRDRLSGPAEAIRPLGLTSNSRRRAATSSDSPPGKAGRAPCRRRSAPSAPAPRSP